VSIAIVFLLANQNLIVISTLFNPKTPYALWDWDESAQLLVGGTMVRTFARAFFRFLARHKKRAEELMIGWGQVSDGP
jgi:hypothetical protein